MWHSNGGRYFPSRPSRFYDKSLASSPWTYIVRVDPAAPADPNDPWVEPAAPAMVPGMIEIEGKLYRLAQVAGIKLGQPDTEEKIELWTRAWEFTEREIGRLRAEGARQASRSNLEILESDLRRVKAELYGEPQPAASEWRPASEKPRNIEDLVILSPHGEVQGYYHPYGDWYVYDAEGDAYIIDPADVFGWRELPRAKVEKDAEGRWRVLGVVR
jgi:hypothetical protein